MKKFSLRSRLILLFSGTIIIAGGITVGISYFQTQKALKDVFDNQQMIFARRLASHNVQRFIRHQIYDIDVTLKNSKLDELKFDDDELAFAIFNRNGEKVLHDGEDGENFVFNPKALTAKKPIFTQTRKWHILWIPTPNRSHIIAVGQSWEYRENTILSFVIAQTVPWVVALTLLMLVVIVMITREFLPLNTLAAAIKKRDPEDSTPISGENAPTEVQPLIRAINTLLSRISAMLARERRFTSNAAHELRTPLAALRIQAEVAQLTEADPQKRQHALKNIISGIDRAAYLIDQMLVLSRLNAHSDLIEKERIDWASLLAHTASESSLQLTARHIMLSSEIREPVKNLYGNSTFISLLLRNLIDNAVKYTPKESQVNIIVQNNQLTVEDNGPGVSSDVLAKLGEQFFRAADQNTTGSGLGLSIVKQIAELHHAHVTFYNRQSGGFGVKLVW